MWINSIEKRETAKWLPLLEHWVLGTCVILVKEKSSWKYWLLWWWKEKKDKKIEDTLIRELEEEIGNQHTIEMKKKLITIETNSQIHNVFALKLWWKFYPNENEIAGLAFYPLNDKYTAEREAMKQNMENYAIKAVNEFKHNHDRKSYEVSEPKIDWKYFDQFHRELDDLMQQILKKNKN